MFIPVIAENNWFCDDDLVWLDGWLKQSSKRHLLDSSKLVCSNASAKAEVGVPLRTGLRNIIVRKYIKRSPTCAKLCHCYPENGFPIVDCRNKGLTKIPRSVPKHTRIVHLNSNRISKIDKSSWTSGSWQDVHFLDLRNNSISSISSLEGTNFLRNLGALDVSHNAISYVPIHLLKQMGHIQVLKLSGNPWKCDCNTVVFQVGSVITLNVLPGKTNNMMHAHVCRCGRVVNSRGLHGLPCRCSAAGSLDMLI